MVGSGLRAPSIEIDRRPDVWRGRVSSRLLPAGIATGVSALDAELVWGGWPSGGLSEVLSDLPGEGLAVLLPALARLSQQSRWLLLVDPPFQPFAPALAAHGLDLRRLILVTAGDARAWAAEQGLRSKSCAAVLVWGGGRWEDVALRRLQLAAEQGEAMAVLFRAEAAARSPSPAMLRLLIRPASYGRELHLIKQRGGPAGARVRLQAPGLGGEVAGGLTDTISQG